MDGKLIYEVLSVVEEIPRGKVATYGQIARLIRNVMTVGEEAYRRETCQFKRWHVSYSLALDFSTSRHRFIMDNTQAQVAGIRLFCTFGPDSIFFFFFFLRKLNILFQV